MRLTGAIWPSVPSGRRLASAPVAERSLDSVARANVAPLAGDRSPLPASRITRSRRTRVLNYRVVVNPRNNGLQVSGPSRVINLKRRNTFTLPARP